MIVVSAWVASALVFVAFFMKTMVPLRLVAIASNAAFIVYALLALEGGVFGKVYPILVLHSCLLPLNVIRLAQILKVMRAARRSAEGDLIAVLVPFMKRETHRAGTQLFRRGDPADSLYLVVEGVVMLEEEEKRIEAGEVFGELGMFRKDTARTMTVTCAEDCTLDRLGRDKAFELCYQHPKFGIYLLRLIAGYVPELKRTPHEASLELERLPV